MLGIAMLIVLLPSTVLARSFSDVSTSSTFYEHVESLANQGIVSGYMGNFYPDNFLTRGEITKIMLGAAGHDLDYGTGRMFNDVGIDSDFYYYINTAASLDIVGGYEDGNFGPNDLVKRGEAIKILVSAFDFEVDTTGGPHFIDVAAGNDFYEAIETAYNRSVISGVGNTFWPDNYMTRGEMAKIVNLARQRGGGAESYLLDFNDGVFPQGSAELTQSTDDKLLFTFDDLPELDNDYKYEAWLIGGGETVSAGKFNVNDEGEMVDDRGERLSNVLDANVDVVDYETVEITVEQSDDPSEDPSETVVLEGDIDDEGDVILGFPRAITGVAVNAYVGGADNDEITFSLLGLPEVDDLGLRYEAFVMDDSEYVSLGKFAADADGGTTYMAEYSSDLTEVGKFTVGLEPDPDDNYQPYLLLWSVTVDASDGLSDDEWGTCDFDESIYDGLTTTSTSESIICRTVEERDEDNDVIVQAYASAPVAPAGGEVGIVIKVSDLEGNPINDLSLDITQTSGLEGTISDPRERGNSGVYIGSFVSPASGFSLSSNTAELTISKESGSTNDHYFPTTELSLETKSSSRKGTPSVMEIDVTVDELTYNEGESGQEEDVRVIATLLDSAHRTVETSSSSTYRNSIKLNGTSSRNDNETPDQVEGNLYLYDVDLGDLFDSNSDVELTASEDFQIEFYDRSTSGAYLPITSDRYSVSIHYVPEED